MIISINMIIIITGALPSGLLCDDNDHVNTDNHRNCDNDYNIITITIIIIIIV